MPLLMRWAGPVSGSALYMFLESSGLPNQMCAVAGLAAWMAVWWITETVDLGITSLLPLVILPVTGVMDMTDVAAQYMEQTVFLFIGGFFMAYSMEKWKLHERLAYRIIIATGATPVRVLSGIMITTFFVSMWISNTATTLMMLTAVMAIVQHKDLFDLRVRNRMATGYLLALTYTASIGGMSTLVGTPTNMILAGFIETNYQNRIDLNFMDWFGQAFPMALTLAIATFFVIRYRYFREGGKRPFDLGFIRQRYAALGNMTKQEIRVMVVFSSIVLLWFTRTDIDFGFIKFTGWTHLLPWGTMVKDSTIAIIGSLALFLLPSGKNNESLLGWDDVTRLPFRILLLFGSGFALAAAFNKSGLATAIASKLTVLQGWPVIAFVVSVVILVTALSEFASNVASIQLMLPILAPLAVTLNVDPLLLMVPATLAASLGYMMPVATAPNTIVFGTGMIPMREMVHTGLVINIIGAILISLFQLI
ncbi:MAG: SLC13 family permease [Bacteroidota bacterium]